MNANPLAGYRKEIDALDDQIVDLLSRRFANRQRSRCL
jgi:chorismate mutase